MKKEDISEALNDVDFDMVEEAYEKRRKTSWRRWAALAACLVLIIGAAIVFSMQQPNVPTWDTPHFSAAEIGTLFGKSTLDSGGTKAYTKVYTTKSKYLYINEVPKSGYLGIYQQQNVEKELNEAELQSFTDTYLSKLAAALGTTMPEYTVKFWESSYGGDRYDVFFSSESSFMMSAQQSGTHNTLWIQKSASRTEDPLLVLDGQPVQVDQRLSDEEILASIEPVQKKLLEILGLSFSDAKVVRRYEDDELYGVYYLYIYFYNENAHPLNALSTTPLSDYIEIEFDNNWNYEGDFVSDGILKNANIRYTQMRTDVGETIPLIAMAKKLPLEEAETLLNKGYVFSDHACPLCMSQQDQVSFMHYDYVGIEYKFGLFEAEDTTMGIPFYVFYKYIGTSKNLNKTYAKTYVPAIEVSGYEEYFKAQHEKHETKSNLS